MGTVQASKLVDRISGTSYDLHVSSCNRWQRLKLDLHKKLTLDLELVKYDESWLLIFVKITSYRHPSRVLQKYLRDTIFLVFCFSHHSLLFLPKPIQQYQVICGYGVWPQFDHTDLPSETSFTLREMSFRSKSCLILQAFIIDTLPLTSTPISLHIKNHWEVTWMALIRHQVNGWFSKSMCCSRKNEPICKL